MKMLSTDALQLIFLSGTSERTKNVLGHSPKLDTDTSDLGEIRRRRVLEESRVGDLRRSPRSLIGRVRDFRDCPLALRELQLYPSYNRPDLPCSPDS